MDAWTQVFNLVEGILNQCVSRAVATFRNFVCVPSAPAQTFQLEPFPSRWFMSLSETEASADQELPQRFLSLLRSKHPQNNPSWRLGHSIFHWAELNLCRCMLRFPCPGTTFCFEEMLELGGCCSPLDRS